jgi:hypothetical protein
MLQPHIEYQINTHCNLNCKGCIQFAPLSPENNIPIKQIKSELEIFGETEYSKQITYFLIMGGEPLLHPNLSDVIVSARLNLPNMNSIGLCTNGILLHKLPFRVLDTLKAMDIIVAISQYPNVNLTSGIKRLTENKIRYTIFQREYQWSKVTVNAKNPCQCTRDLACGSLAENRIYKCPIMRTKHIYENRFNIKLFDTEYISVNADAVEITTFLNTPCNAECGIISSAYGLSNKYKVEWNQI